MSLRECQVHVDMDRRHGAVRTLRCAHFGMSRVHERLDEDGRRWFNRVYRTVRRPELIHVGPDGDESVWDQLIAEMLDDEDA